MRNRVTQHGSKKPRAVLGYSQTSRRESREQSRPPDGMKFS
jgi:hypothetical protein